PSGSTLTVTTDKDGNVELKLTTKGETRNLKPGKVIDETTNTSGDEEYSSRYQNFELQDKDGNFDSNYPVVITLDSSKNVVGLQIPNGEGERSVVLFGSTITVVLTYQNQGAGSLAAPLVGMQAYDNDSGKPLLDGLAGSSVQGLKEGLQKRDKENGKIS